MLAKKNRLDRALVSEIFKSGRFLPSPNLSLKFKISGNGGSPRISFVAPKTVAKGAVKRNLLRRRGYMAIGGYLDQFPSGFQGVFIFGKKSKDTFGQKGPRGKILLKQELGQILAKI